MQSVREIKATLQAARECWPDKRIAVVFQPHRYTRTRALFEEFTTAFYQSDLLVVLPIYAAGEKKIEGVKGIALFEEIQRHGHKDVVYMDGLEAAVSHLKDILTENDILLTLGAGDVWKVGEMLLDVL